ncbi:MAG TPA: hypothetical protein P5243_05450 [Bacteroidales bacterium]|jgi:hypothetical protein|nr:hypothetical protein [Bacteroidales bacterium]
MRINKKIIVLLLSVASIQAFAQRSTTSLYSRYGYGELYIPSCNFVQMGNVANGIRSAKQIQFINPAHNTAIEKETFLFQVGSGYSYRNFAQQNQHVSKIDAGIEYMAMAFAVIPKKWGMAAGIVPFNTVGYEIQAADSLAQYTYSGKGGINQFIWSNSISPVKGLSIGANASLLFGKTIYTSNAKVLVDEFSYYTRKQQIYDAKGFMWDAGLQYTYPINDKSSVTFGATYRNKQTFSFHKQSYLGTYNVLEQIDVNKKKRKTITTVYESYTEIDTLHNIITRNIESDIPQQVSFGIGYSIQDKFTGAFDCGYSNWNSVSVWGKPSIYTGNAKFARLGVEFIPDKRGASYFKKIPYRIGLQYNELPISYTFNNTLLKPIDFGISFGSEFLLKQTANSLAVSVITGRRGDISSAQSLQELYTMIKLQINLKETWFLQRKID